MSQPAFEISHNHHASMGWGSGWVGLEGMGAELVGYLCGLPLLRLHCLHHSWLRCVALSQHFESLYAIGNSVL
jgi:hypothetical protein